MLTSFDKPDNYSEIAAHFPIDWNDGVIITYGDTVHCKYRISPAKEIHEQTHIQQQTVMGRDIWWQLYFNDVKFRLLQETEAYQNEAKYIKENVHDRNLKYLMLRQLAKDLSSPMYGSMISYSQAIKLIQ